MTKRYFLNLAILCASLLFSTYAFSLVQAEVNSNEITSGEPIVLKISGDDVDKADLSVLNKNFTIQSRGYSQSMSIINGKATSIKQLQIGLIPKNYAQTITIPAISVGNEKTSPINVRLGNAPQIDPNKTNEELITLTLTAQTHDVYLNQSLPVKLVATIPEAVLLQMRNLEMNSDQNSSEIMARPIGQNQQRKIINGQPFIQITMDYSLTFNFSGKVKLPAFILKGLLYKNGRNLGYEFKSNTLDFNVSPKPANYPHGSNWLPAKQLTVNQRWGADLNNLKVGDSLTRNIDMTAVGLNSELLELPKMTAPANTKIYQNKPNYGQLNYNSNKDVVGNAQFSNSYVFTNVGKVTIPEQIIPWFNTKTKKQEKITLPAQTLTISKNPELSDTQNGVGNNSNSIAMPDTDNMGSKQENNPATIIDQAEQTSRYDSNVTNKSLISFGSLLLWQIISLLLFITAMILVIIIVILTKNKKNKPQQQQQNNKKEIDNSEILAKLKQATQNNNPIEVKRCFDHYIQLNDISKEQLFNASSELKQAMAELNKALYDHSELNIWQSNDFYSIFTQAIKKLSKLKKDEKTLPPLYPQS